MLLLPCLLSLLGCGGSSGEATNTETESPPAYHPPSADSLQLLYERYYAALSDTLPLTQVREQGRVYPVDEAPRDQAFFVFREQLREAIAQRAVFRLLDALSPNIKVSFGGEQGVEDFVTTWQLDSKQPDTLAIWDLLEGVFAQGGTFSDGGQAFQAPYYFSTWPDQYDAFDHAVVTGSGVRLREQPSLNSTIIKTVSYEVVKVLAAETNQQVTEGEYPWRRVALLDGREGYIYGQFIGNPIGLRAGFAYDAQAGWQMTFWVAGD